MTIYVQIRFNLTHKSTKAIKSVGYIPVLKHALLGNPIAHGIKHDIVCMP
jgi:uncharacterized membrane protein YjgN (DUF898 family)